MHRYNLFLSAETIATLTGYGGVSTSEHIRRAIDDYIRAKEMASVKNALSPTSQSPFQQADGQCVSPSSPPDALDTMDFPLAMTAIIAGKRIRKLEWQDRGYYGILRDGRLKLHKPDGQDYDWIITDGDLMGNDWIVI